MPKDPRTLSTVPVEEIRRIVAENAALRDGLLGKLTERECPVCDKPYLPGRRDQKFCSDKCRWVWQKLRDTLNAVAMKG